MKCKVVCQRRKESEEASALIDTPNVVYLYYCSTRKKKNI